MRRDTQIWEISGLQRLLQSKAAKLSKFSGHVPANSARAVAEDGLDESTRRDEQRVIIERFGSDPGSDPLLEFKGPMTMDQIRAQFALLKAKAQAGELA